MSAAPDDSPRIPRWAVGIVAGLAVAAGGWTATTALTLREARVVHEDRIGRLEARAAGTEAGLAVLADIKSDMRLLTAEVGRLREDLKSTPRPR